MKGYEDSTYGDRVAGIYDELYADVPGTERVVAALAELAGSGPVLELGIGTGRLALPLAEPGLEVHRIDASEAMVAKLREKLGGDRPVTIGNFADVGVEGRYRLVFAAFNTFFSLRSQDEQVRCFENVAAASETTASSCSRPSSPIPPASPAAGWESSASSSTTSGCSRAGQRRLSEGGVDLYPIRVRWAWPSELDLMARLAGLRLRERWPDWGREPFTGESQKHVSVYEKG